MTHSGEVDNLSGSVSALRQYLFSADEEDSVYGENDLMNISKNPINEIMLLADFFHQTLYTGYFMKYSYFSMGSP